MSKHRAGHPASQKKEERASQKERPAAKKNTERLASQQSVWRGWPVALGAIVYSWAVCQMSGTAIQWTALALAALTVAAAFLWWGRLRDRMGIPLLLLAAYTALDGVSTLYAVSGKLALGEFLKVLCALCLSLLLLAAAPERDGARWIGGTLSGAAGVLGLVSIDLLSTHVLSDAAAWVLGQTGVSFSPQAGVEAGVRMTSLLGTPNVFAGIAGLGTLLALGLADTAESKKERTVHTAVLYVDALSFLLVFSMGGTGAIAVSFLVLLALERRERRMGLLVLMVETLLVTVLSAAIISLTSFEAWTGPQLVPLLCVIAGVAALCALDRTLGRRAAERLAGRTRLAPAVICGVLAAVIAYGAAALLVTGPATLGPGETLRRAVYPSPGDYTLSVQTDQPVEVRIESQDRRETMMHTGTELYAGPAEGAAFTVPEGSLVVYLDIRAPEGAHLERVAYSGESGEGTVPLGYRLLPGFMANRVQGLRANENAIQRLVFFGDGLALWRRSPVIGLGLGAFENGIRSVQSFYYETRYAHDHYIQALAETGIVGLVLFLALLGGNGAAVFFAWRKGKARLAPALGAALVFMAGHAAVEVVFSYYAYLPFAFGTFALVSLCCGAALPRPHLGRRGKSIALAVVTLLIAAYAVLLGVDMRARYIASTASSLEELGAAADMAPFGWADHALAYLERASTATEGSEARARADGYAARLAALDSNAAPIHVAAYYFETGRRTEGLEMVEKYVSYVSADPAGWECAFQVLEEHWDGTEAYRAGVLEIYDALQRWEATHMGEIELSDEARAFIAEMGGEV